MSSRTGYRRRRRGGGGGGGKKNRRGGKENEATVVEWQRPKKKKSRKLERLFSVSSGGNRLNGHEATRHTYIGETPNLYPYPIEYGVM